MRVSITEAIEHYLKYPISSVYHAFRANNYFDYYEEWKSGVDGEKIFEWGRSSPSIKIHMVLVSKSFNECTEDEKEFLFSNFLVQKISEIYSQTKEIQNA